MSQEVLCSFLLPTRGIPHLTFKSLKSIVGQSSDTISYEVLIAIDSDDKESLDMIPQIYELFHNTKNGTVKIIITERYHYYGLHKYYNLLGKIAKGKLLILWNNNAYILPTLIGGIGIDAPAKESNWDVTLNQDYENLEPHIWLLKSTEIYFGSTNKPHVSNHSFPIIPKKTYDLLGHFSKSPLSDRYLNSVCGMEIKNQPIMKNSRLLLEHHQLPEEIMVTPEDNQKAWAIHHSPKVQKYILKDRDILKKKLEEL
mgnify:CR=1 FL=1